MSSRTITTTNGTTLLAWGAFGPSTQPMRAIRSHYGELVTGPSAGWPGRLGPAVGVAGTSCESWVGGRPSDAHLPTS